MKRLFISQPMRGKTKEEILAAREEAIRIAKLNLGEDEEIEVIDTYLEDTPNVKNVSLWCLGESLKLMADADIVFFADGWDDYRGCKIEHDCAYRYGVPVFGFIAK